jgi:hypothetical protein
MLYIYTETASQYPYTSGSGISGQCKSKSSKFVASITGFTYAVPTCQSGSCDSQQQHSDAALTALHNRGPISICVDATQWQFYSGGVMSSNCPHAANNLDHCVQMTGYEYVFCSLFVFCGAVL